MKFNERKFPILGRMSNAMDLFKFQESGFTKVLGVMEDRKSTSQEIYDSAAVVLTHKTIDYVSPSFFDKVVDENIFSKLHHLFCKINECDGILLYPKKRFSQIHAVSYLLFPDAIKDELCGTIKMYSDVGLVVSIAIRIRNETIDWRALKSDSVNMDSNGAHHSKEMLDQWIINHVQSLLSIITFKQFAEIETTNIGGIEYPKKIKVGHDKYFNECDNEINILDSRWFTETIRTDGFPVSGHFRLQPCGPNMSQRKLIYIDDFLKEGYSRTARIEAARDN